ncbi:TetR/AcrR family transcriptional regulator [Bacillaceae bacterium Marseille-Q3522]|nr:TetR/AcrR family transcriptional regulator [Bacillaceae bacterium Marseille-Q3522]
MGINERKKKEKAIRRTDIIEAAERIFFSKGYDHSTMDDVAKAAEFSKRTIYVYFNSKEQLYFEVMIRGYKKLLAMLKENQKLNQAADAIEELRQLAMTLYRFSNEHREYFQAIMEYENGQLDFQNGIPDRSRDECYALGEELIGYLIQALKRGITEGDFRKDLSIVRTALVLWACMIGVFNTAKKKAQYIKNFHQTETGEFILESFQLIIRSIKMEKGGSHS